jgi:predicted nucleic acid-binding protein
LILADTSVWVEHLRRGEPRLERLLLAAEVASHPFVIGELALGHLRQLNEILALLHALPPVELPSHEETFAFVERKKLAGSGIGWVDAHLLAAAALSGARLYTLDRRLASVGARLGLAFETAP